MIRGKRVAYALFAYGIGILLLTLPRCASAEEAAPCRQVGAEVVCNAAEFDRLMAMLLAKKAEAEVCALRLGECATRPAPFCPTTPLPPPVAPAAVTTASPRPVLAVTLSMAGGAALLASALADVSSTTRAGLATAGLASLGSALVLVSW